MRVAATLLLSSLLLLSAGAGAAAVAAPTAITGPVSAIGTNSATATGTVNPNGQATNWFFEYGTSTSYGRRTATRSAGSGTTNVQVSAALTGLVPGTTYHYRLVATGGGGTTRGADGIFTTSAAPVAVTGAASRRHADIGQARRVCRPQRTCDHAGSSSTGRARRYGARTATRSAGSGTTARSVSMQLSGLAPGSLFHYRLVATSDAGTSRGADRTFATTGPPVARTGATLEIGSTTARTTGSVNPLGRRTTWYFEYGTTTRYGSRTPSRNAGSGFGDAGGELAALAASHGRDVPLSPRRKERRRHDAGRRSHLQNDRRDAGDAHARRRLRASRHALGPSDDRAPGRARFGVCPAVRRRFAGRGCDGPHRFVRRLAVPGEALDPHRVSG